MKLAFLFAILAFAATAGGVDAPSVGYGRNPAGSIVRVSGVSGAFVVAATDQTGVVSAAFSERLGLVKTDSTVRVLDAAGNLLNECDAPAGPALFGFDASGRTGAAWYPSTHALMFYGDSQWNPVPFDANGGAVLAVAVKDNERVLAVVQSDQLTIVRIRLVDGAVEDVTSLGSSGGPAHLFGDGTALFHRDGAIVRRTPGGAELAVDGLTDVTGFLPMGADWVQARTASGRSFALRLSPEPRFFVLPEVSQ
jgi:hypothetical protein